MITEYESSSLVGQIIYVQNMEYIKNTTKNEEVFPVLS